MVFVALCVFGLFGLLSIPRESSPEVRVPIAIVTTVFPGASAVDVEELITDEIEKQLEGGLDSVKKISSVSREGVSNVTVEFNAEADLDKSIQDVKDEVDKVTSELPDDANDPAVTDVDFADEPVLTISLVSDLPVTELIDLSEDLEDELKSISGVSKVEVSGVPEREVQIIVSQDSLSKFNIALTDVVRAIQSANSSLPAGTIELGDAQYNVSFEGDIKNTSEIENIAIINNSGQPVYVRDIAFVSDGVSNLTTLARTSINGEPSEPAVSLSVYKRSGGDVTRLSDSIRERLVELEEGLLKDSDYLISFDNGEFVKEDLTNLAKTAVQTISLVLLILLITIGWREAFIAAFAIPLSFLIAFIGLYGSGNTINFVSLFSLILSVGVLVDSAIVVTEAVHTKKQNLGMSGFEAAKATIKEFHYPLLTGTLTTIAVFAPLFIVSGVSGQFIAAIPFTIIFVLLASLFVALAFVPLISAKLLKSNKHNSGDYSYEESESVRDRITNKFTDWYRKFLTDFLQSKVKQRVFVILIVLLFVITASFPFLGFVKVIFFESSDTDFLFVEVEKPEGTLLEITDLSAREVEEILLDQKDIESYIVEIGRGSQFGSGGVNEKLASMTLLLKDDRSITSSELLEVLRKDLSVVKSASVRVFQPSDGPPTGAPITVKFLGDSLESIEVALNQSESVLKETTGTREVEKNTKSDSSEFSLEVDRAKISQFGLDPAGIAFTLRTALFGTDATTIKNNGDNIDVVVKLDINKDFTTPDSTNRTNIDSIESIELKTPSGNTVLLGNLVEAKIKKSNEVINHEDRKRIGSISSHIAKGANTREVLAEFNKKMENVELPKGVVMKIGGETEESNTAFKEMGLSLIIGMIAILSILVLQFHSYRYALYILAIVPLSLIGVFTGLAISGQPLSFPSMMGFIALSGIVVNNSIILIDRMNKLRREGYSIEEVVINGATSRLRPILLTTITTVIGITPLIYTSDLWGPLAFSIIFGLSFAVFITLILVPMLYFKWPGKISHGFEVSNNKDSKNNYE